MECEYERRKKCDSLYIERYNKLLKEIERLKNIIKELREYIENSKVRKPWVKGNYILKILDKGEDK